MGDAQVGRVQCAWPDHTGVQEAAGQNSGPWNGASQAPGAPATNPQAGLLGCRGHRARPPGAASCPLVPGREQLRALGLGTFLPIPNYSRAVPTGFLWRAGARGLGSGGSDGLRLSSPPPRAANGVQPARGLSWVSRPEPISAQSAFPKSCKQSPGSGEEREAGSGGGDGAGGGVTHPTGPCSGCGCLGNWARVGALHQ